MSLSRPVAPRARRTALITASVPEFTMRTISMCGTMATIFSAISTSSAVGAPNDRPFSMRACTAFRMSGWLWPSTIGPHEPI